MISCLVAAALWALAVSIFKGSIQRMGPGIVNLGKCALAALAFWIWAAFLDWSPEAGTPWQWGAIALSGVIGMAVGDLLLFVAVREGGVQRALVIFNTSPILAALAAMPIYDEHPTLAGWGGIGLILAGVTMVETDPRRRVSTSGMDRGRPVMALFAGLGAAAGQAAGIVMTRGPLQEIPLVPASALRLSAAALALVVIFVLTARGRAALAGSTWRDWRGLALPTTIGTILAVYFMMRGIREVPAGVSAALLATSPIFALPISRFVLGESLGVRSVLGTMLVVAGVALL